jgi:CRP-like cAMP-binding protein
MPRNADISALEDGEVWEVRRNVLDRMMRSPAQRELFERLYRERALATASSTSAFFAGLPQSENDLISEFLKPRLKFYRVSPRMIIFGQGDLADCLYLIRLGHVRVGISRYGKEATVLYRGPGTVIGEIGLLALSREDTGKTPEEVDGDVCAALNYAPAGNLAAGERTATCSALDHVELARVDRIDFLEMIRKCPMLRRKLIKVALDRLKEI